MILRSIQLENFRGYDNIVIPFSENLNVIIGKNDIGKSTILEALEIFFNNNMIQIQNEDLKKGSTEEKMSICLSFKIDTQKKYLIDTDRETSLADEYLLNKNGLLEVRKEWDCTKSVTTKSSLTTYLVADYLKDFVDQPLVTLKITELKKLCHERDIEDLVEDKRVASDYRKAIYMSNSSSEKETALIPIDKEDAKKIYDQISSEFPYYALFQSDRQNKDTDKEVQDPLKIITKKAISEVEDRLEEVVNEIQYKAIEIGRKTIAKLEEMSPEIAKTLTPNVKNKNWDSLFSFSFTGDDDIPINKRGSGVRRLILLNYFRAEAEENILGGKNLIYGIEEPETSQHPNFQKMLMESLIKIGNGEKKQVIITTHSPEIAKIAKSENLILIRRNEEKRIISEENDDNKLMLIRETLGILPYLSKLVICVEGEHDIIFLKTINQNIPELKSIFDLKEKKVSIIPMNGGNLCNWVERDYLKNTNVREFHLYDSDSNSGRNTGQYKKYVDEINRRNNGDYALLTQKRELENYIPKVLYEEFFQEINLDSITDWDNADIPKIIESKTTKNESNIKHIANGKLSGKLTKQMLEDMNAFEEIQSWFMKMKEMYEG